MALEQTPSLDLFPSVEGQVRVILQAYIKSLLPSLYPMPKV